MIAEWTKEKTIGHMDGKTDEMISDLTSYRGIYKSPSIIVTL